MDVTTWLTEDSEPPVAYLARHHLLGEDTDSRKMKSLWLAGTARIDLCEPV